MNSVTLVGALTKDPDLREGEKTKVCRIRMAENGRSGSPLYINVSVFGRQAETCTQYLTKGRQVAVAGQLRFREWEADDGAKRSEYSIAADRVDFLSDGKGRRSANGDPESLLEAEAS
jgi:single-strand DNA-binding protein